MFIASIGFLATIGIVRLITHAIRAGVGAALTLDEFALWLNLRDVYWEKEGHESIQAILIFGSLLSVGAWGGPFLMGVGRHLWDRARR
jgi:hypothetical protein